MRNGAVIDIDITAGHVRAQVMGSSLYQVDVRVTALADAQWRAIGAECAQSIDSLVELLQGRLSKAVMARICQPGTGLFPSPREIAFDCSCPDWAAMCKHVAAVLYGVATRLDQEPGLLFTLRQVDAQDLIARVDAGMKPTRKRPSARRVLDEASLADVFGIEMAAPLVPARAAAEKPTAKVAAAAAAKGSKSARSETNPRDAKRKTTRAKPPAPVSLGAALAAAQPKARVPKPRKKAP
ncbi:MAG: hypothetical protein M0037_03115 [Betaproteobacteria bacterium]|nr:hypothetical protein [Betaproteobacteria bacterium]